MKVPNKVKDIVNRLADYARKLQRLNYQLSVELDKMGVDRDCEAFENAFGYVEGDCYPQPFLDYLEQLQSSDYAR